MKILLMIDHFGSGGAQKQLTILAQGLKNRGHDVSVFTYHRHHDFFRYSMEASDIRLFDAPDNTRFHQRILHLLKILKAEKFDATISYLKTPNTINEIAGILSKQSKVFVSERSSRFCDENHVAAQGQRMFHGLASGIITNSPSHGSWLQKTLPHLKRKVHVIMNGYPVPEMAAISPPDRPQDLRLIAVATVLPRKQPDLLIKALCEVHRRRGWVPMVTWVGRREKHGADYDYACRLDALLDQSPEVKHAWTWAGERKDVPLLMADHHLLVHPGRHEGLSNTLCEALFLGRPILAGRVCDHPFMVGQDERGGLFDIDDLNEFADRIEEFMDMHSETYAAKCRAARQFAVEQFTIDRFVTDYEKVLGA